MDGHKDILYEDFVEDMIHTNPESLKWSISGDVEWLKKAVMNGEQLIIHTTSVKAPWLFYNTVLALAIATSNKPEDMYVFPLHFGMYHDQETQIPGIPYDSSEYRETINLLVELFNMEECKCIGFNLKDQLKRLETSGISVEHMSDRIGHEILQMYWASGGRKDNGVVPNSFNAAYVMFYQDRDNKSKNTKQMDEMFENMPIAYDSSLSSHMDIIQSSLFYLYCTANIACDLYNDLNQNPSNYRVYHEISIPAIQAFMDMEKHGILYDYRGAIQIRNHADSLLEIIESDLIAIGKNDAGNIMREYFKKHGRIDFSDETLLLDILFTPRGYNLTPLVVNQDGRPSLSWKNHLIHLSKENKFIKRLCDLQRLLYLKKIHFGSGGSKTLFAERWCDLNGIIHTTFSLHETVTGRATSVSPPLHNLPTRGEFAYMALSPFTPKEGNVFVGVDVCQSELRYAAVEAGEDHMIELFNQGVDIHSYIAATVVCHVSYEQFMSPGFMPDDERKKWRDSAKGIVFGMLYGIRKAGLASYITGTYGVQCSEEQAMNYIDEFNKTFPMFNQWKDKKIKEVSEGKGVRAAHGAVMGFYGYPGRINDSEKRQICNAPIQRLSSDASAVALARINREGREKDIVPVMFNQDCIIVETPQDKVAEAARLVQECMEDTEWAKRFGFEINVPIKTEAKCGYSLLLDMKISEMS